MRRLLHLGVALVALACTPVDDPRPGTQIGVEESGGCEDDLVVPVVDPEEVPPGAERSFDDAVQGADGRFVGTTAGGEALTVTLEADRTEAVWVEQVPLEGAELVGCPSVWRIPVTAEVLSVDVAWSGEGTLTLQDDRSAAVRVEGTADVGRPPPDDLDPATARLSAFGGDGAYTVLLLWREAGPPDGDAPEAPVLRGDVELDGS
jgi:hypothetical protein